jgi:hypothetical protein
MREDVPNENTNDENVRGGAGGEDSEDVTEAWDSGSADGSVDEVVDSSGAAERPRLSRTTNPCSSSLIIEPPYREKQYHYQRVPIKNPEIT